jgi:hypothetical protein
MNASYVNAHDISDLENDVFKQGKLIAAPLDYYSQFPFEKLRFFMGIHGLYMLPTIELIDFLKFWIGGGTAIDIAAGNGSLGRSLDIPITDIKLQEIPAVAAYYKSIGQPVTTYPDDVERLDYKEAITKYNPQTVVCSFATHLDHDGSTGGSPIGIDYKYILSKVKTLIHIGNLDVHRTNPALKRAHYSFQGDYIITRCTNKKQNRIFIWVNK